MKAALVMIFFAASAFGQEIPVAAAESACGPADTQFTIKTTDGLQSLRQPEPGKALVYVIEDQKMSYVRSVTSRVGLDGAWVGANRGNSYLFFSVDPGEHHLCADWVSDFVAGGRVVALAPLTAEAGKTYYFRARTIAGASSLGEKLRENGASIDLDPVNSDEGKLLVASSALSVSHPKK